ncbi:MAG: NIPSNAP family protein [Gammaproteobacteria bacterium]|nr:NIPSNAP family protein [Gammaproteobacteria bacterium]
MFTCLIKYTLDPNKLDYFELYARTWIALIEKYGGKHHGYFIPGREGDLFPDPFFSFPGIGKCGEDNVAFALFSFPSIEAYVMYKTEVAKDRKCKAATELFNQTKCFLSYERFFLKPIFSKLKKERKPDENISN